MWVQSGRSGSAPSPDPGGDEVARACVKMSIVALQMCCHAKPSRRLYRLRGGPNSSHTHAHTLTHTRARGTEGSQQVTLKDGSIVFSQCSLEKSHSALVVGVWSLVGRDWSLCSLFVQCTQFTSLHLPSKMPWCCFKIHFVESVAQNSQGQVFSETWGLTVQLGGFSVDSEVKNLLR